MLWILISLFFCWLILREFKRSMTSLGFDMAPPEPVYKPYVAVLLVLAMLFAWPPFHYWHFQRYLSGIATKLADAHPARVHCNTAFDSILDRETTFSHASPETGEIVFQPPLCETLMSYLDHPDRANLKELHSLNTLTHESMHVRGELNEAKTECEAVQRNYRTAKLLGVPDNIARKNALDYYYGLYMQLGQGGPNAVRYFSDQCAPGKDMDENLSDSTWITLKTIPSEQTND
jgi:hypothetical protein